MLRIELPLPARQLSPNARVHWVIKARYTREARAMVVAEVLAQLARGTPLTKATVTVTFMVPDKRRRDHGNLIAAAKAYIDGLVDAGVIADDNTRVIREVYPPVEYRKGQPGTLIEVIEA